MTAIDPTYADPLLVPSEQDTTTRTSTSGGRVMSKDSKNAIASEYDANQREAKAQGQVGEQQALLDARKADQLAEAADLAHQQAADQAAEHQAYLDRIDRARSAAANAEEKFANHKFEDFWSHQGVGKRIASAFGLFFGGMGAGYNGGDNPAMTAIHRAMDQDFAKQKAELDQKRESARMAGADVNELFAQEGHENAALAIKHAKANEATAASMVQAMAEAGIPLDQAKNNVTVQSLLARAEEKRREALQHYDRTFSGTTSKKEVEKTGPDAKNTALGLRERQQLKTDQERWFKENNGPKISATNHMLNGIEEKLFDEKGNVRKDIDPATQKFILMEMDTASRNGTATGASMRAVLDSLGGTGDKFATFVEHAGTGGMGRGALNVLAHGVKSARRANKAEAADLQKSYSETYYQAPELQHLHPEIVTGETKYLRQFGYAQRPGAAAPAAAPAQGGTPVPPSGAPPPPPAASPNRRFVRLKTGETGYLATDGTFFPSAAPTAAGP